MNRIFACIQNLINYDVTKIVECDGIISIYCSCSIDGKFVGVSALKGSLIQFRFLVFSIFKEYNTSDNNDLSFIQ
jgi:hypothetical protein